MLIMCFHFFQNIVHIITQTTVLAITMPIGNPYIDDTATEASGEEDQEVELGDGEENPKESEPSIYYKYIP